MTQHGLADISYYQEQRPVTDGPLDPMDGQGPSDEYAGVEQKLAFLLDLGDLLSTSLDYERTLLHIFDLLVPHFADWCMVDVAAEGGCLERRLVAHGDPQKQDYADKLRERFAPGQNSAHGPGYVFRTGKPELCEAISQTWEREASLDDEHVALLRALGLQSYVCVPLIARRRTIGTLFMAMGESGRRYGRRDTVFAQMLASRVSLALDNARLYAKANEAREHMEFILDAAGMGRWEWNLDTDTVWCLDAKKEDGPASSNASKTVDNSLAGIHPEDRPQVEEVLARIRQDGGALHLEYRAMRPDGDYAWIEVHGQPSPDAAGRVTRVYGIYRDITERKQQELAQARLAAIVASSNEGIIGKTLEGIVTSWNAGAERLFGYTADEMIGQYIGRIVPPERQAEVRHVLRAVARGEQIDQLETVRLTRDGRLIEILLSASPVLDARGRLVGIASIKRDISDRKRLERELKHKALHDALTGLANRELFLDRLKHILDRARREAIDYAVLILDIDNFKGVNDCYGHLTGDALLVEFSRRVGRCLRPMDTFARLGGDEFAVLLEQTDGEVGVSRVATRIGEALAVPFRHGGRLLSCQASIGATLGSGHHSRAESVLRAADAALYRAKATGKGRFCLL